MGISHSHGTGVVLVLRQPSNALKPAAPVGVDLEHHRTRRFSSLARRFFLPGESIALSSAAEQGSKAEARVFFEMWTKKEAWLKALGVGIGGGLGSLDCSSGNLVQECSMNITGEAGKLYSVSSLLGLPLDAYSVATALPRNIPIR